MPSGEGKAGMAAIIKNEAQDIDFCALPDHLNSVLPKYALPLFIRLVNELEQTATHKFKKNDLKNEGYDPNKTGPDVYVLLPGKNSYTPLTNVIYQEIIDGKYRF
jgi:acyl-CoA synthetase (AMP-forming)/AMP-acid ligase II